MRKALITQHGVNGYDVQSVYIANRAPSAERPPQVNASSQKIAKWLLKGVLFFLLTRAINQQIAVAVGGGATSKLEEEKYRKRPQV